METNEQRSIIEAPELLHWTKVFLLKNVLVELQKSSKIARNTILSLTNSPERLEFSKKEVEDRLATFEQVLMNNEKSVITAAQVMGKAVMEIPDHMRQWPSLN